MIVIRLNASPAHRAEIFKEIDAMAAIPGCCDICWLGVGGTPDISYHHETAKYLAEVAQYVRARGMRVGIEINSLGHGDSRSPSDTAADAFEKMVGPDGYVADGAYCPWGKTTQAYWAEWVKAYMCCEPDGFYLDDDLRMEFHGRATFGCFCDDCIARFNAAWGTSFTREEIVQKLATDPLWRERYVEQNRLGMADFMRNVARTAHKYSPKTQVGWEYVLLTEYTGSDWEPVFKAIYEETGMAPLSRPGCFFYEDHEPRKMLDKVLNTSYQVSVTPDYVKSRRPEVENTSHTVMGKSIQGTCVESTLNLAYGCNGLSYSMLSAVTEPIATRERMWRAFATHRPYWQALIEEQPGTGIGGVCLAHSPDAWKTVVPGDTGFEWVNVPVKNERKLCEVGLPVSYEAKYCKVTALDADMARRLTDADVRALLAGRVITDGETVEVLRARGFALPISAKPGTSRREIYVEHPANGCVAGFSGVADGYTPGVRVQELIPGDGCEILAYADDAARVEKHEVDTGKPVTCALVHTAEGGLWGVVGMALWTVIVNGARRRQLTNLADYLAGGLPAYLETDDQAMLVPRVDADGYCVACTVVNLTIGEMQPLTLALRPRAGAHLVLARPGYADVPLAVRWDGGLARVEIPALAAWSSATVRAAQVPVFAFNGRA